MSRALRIRPAFLAAFIVLNAALIAGYFTFVRRPGPAVRVHAAETQATNLSLPEFALTDAGGKTVTRADFEGKIWLANFIYTNCPAQCPMLSTKMSALQQLYPDRVHLASFSVDPQNDTPEKMAAYAERFRANPARWKFLTGMRAEIDRVLAALGAPSGAAPELHSLRVYLIDPDGRVEGLYDTSEPKSLENLSRGVRRLLKENPA